MKLYHTGKTVIRLPDILHGRKNADFGPGFYLTPDREFAARWAWADSVINEYELETDGLEIRRLDRDEDWFRAVFSNRRGKDTLAADAVIGPIANDTIFDTLGIITSGYLDPEKALRLLRIGPAYTQVALKTEKAIRQLRWTGAETVTAAQGNREEQEAYMEQFAAELAKMEAEEASAGGPG